VSDISGRSDKIVELSEEPEKPESADGGQARLERSIGILNKRRKRVTEELTASRQGGGRLGPQDMKLVAELTAINDLVRSKSAPLVKRDGFVDLASTDVSRAGASGGTSTTTTGGDPPAIEALQDDSRPIQRLTVRDLDALNATPSRAVHTQRELDKALADAAATRIIIAGSERLTLRARYEDKTVTLASGKVIADGEAHLIVDGGQVTARGKAEVEANGGTVSAQGGHVVANARSTVVASGGLVTAREGSTVTVKYGGTVESFGGNLIMDGGTATAEGGRARVSGGTLTITDGEVTATGGTVTAHGGAHLTLSGTAHANAHGSSRVDMAGGTVAADENAQVTVREGEAEAEGSAHVTLHAGSAEVTGKATLIANGGYARAGAHLPAETLVIGGGKVEGAAQPYSGTVTVNGGIVHAGYNARITVNDGIVLADDTATVTVKGGTVYACGRVRVDNDGGNVIALDNAEVLSTSGDVFGSGGHVPDDLGGPRPGPHHPSVKILGGTFIASYESVFVVHGGEGEARVEANVTIYDGIVDAFDDTRITIHHGVLTVKGSPTVRADGGTVVVDADFDAQVSAYGTTKVTLKRGRVTAGGKAVVTAYPGTSVDLVEKTVRLAGADGTILPEDEDPARVRVDRKYRTGWISPDDGNIERAMNEATRRPASRGKKEEPNVAGTRAADQDLVKKEEKIVYLFGSDSISDRIVTKAVASDTNPFPTKNAVGPSDQKFYYPVMVRGGERVQPGEYGWVIDADERLFLFNADTDKVFGIHEDKVIETRTRRYANDRDKQGKMTERNANELTELLQQGYKLLRHTSAAGGEPVIGAGLMKVIAWTYDSRNEYKSPIGELTDESGHYRPLVSNTGRAAQVLIKMGLLAPDSAVTLLGENEGPATGRGGKADITEMAKLHPDFPAGRLQTTARAVGLDPDEIRLRQQQQVMKQIRDTVPLAEPRPDLPRSGQPSLDETVNKIGREQNAEQERLAKLAKEAEAFEKMEAETEAKTNEPKRQARDVRDLMKETAEKRRKEMGSEAAVTVVGEKLTPVWDDTRDTVEEDKEGYWLTEEERREAEEKRQAKFDAMFEDEGGYDTGKESDAESDTGGGDDS
jgi:hypothetical protein